MNTVKGKVLKVETQTGQGKNGEWKRVTIVLETASQYNNVVPIGFFNPEFALPSAGTEVEIDFFVGGWEYQGKYYAQIDGNQLRIVGNNKTPEPQYMTATPANSSGIGEDDEESDDLPF